MRIRSSSRTWHHRSGNPVITEMTATLRLISASSEYEEDVKKEVDNVQVDVESSKDVFLRTEGVGMTPSHHQLGVVDQITGE